MPDPGRYLIALLIGTQITLASPETSVTDGFSPGEMVERVACQSDATESYALYLPANYHPDNDGPFSS